MEPPTSLILIPLLISISAAGLLRLRLDTAEAGDIFRHAKRCLNTSFADSGNIHLCLLLLLTKDRSFSELLSVKSAIACCTCVHAGQCPRHPSSLLFNFVRLFSSDQPGFGDQVHLWKNQTTIWEANIVVDGRRGEEERE